MVLEALGLLSANAFSALAVALMLWMLRNQKDHERRLTTIENDLYVDPKNPSATPLTKQVQILHESIAGQRKSLDRIHETLERYLPGCTPKK